MKRTCLLLLVAILGYWLFLMPPLFAQEPSPKALSIGDTVPNVVLAKIINYHSPKARISDYNGKLLIIDFWATTCAGCIASFPKLEQLQASYKGKLEVMLVTYYKDQSYNQQFFDRRKAGGHPLSLPSVVEDAVLKELFPHSGYPHVVWIDQHSVLRAITYSDAVTPMHIEQALNQEFPLSMRMKVKKKQYPDDLHQWPYLLDYPSGAPLNGRQLFRTFFSNYADTLNKMQYVDRNDDFTRIYFANSTVPAMIKQASECIMAVNDSISADYVHYKGYEKKANSVFPYKDFSDFKVLDYDALDELFTKHCFCYEITLPPFYSLAQAANFLLADLERYLGVHVAFEKRQVEVIYLAAIPKTSQNSINSSQRNERSIELSQMLAYINYDPKLPLLVLNQGDALEDMRVDINLERHYQLEDLARIMNQIGVKMVRRMEMINLAIIQ
ncbi:Thioredoxin-like [bacterium A37T11]|nr:Thioredoxin-like [bacterium A37T11]